MVRVQLLLFPLPMAVVWIMMTNQVSVESFVIGYVVSVGLARLLAQGKRLTIYPQRIPMQLIALAIYGLTLALDILLSGIDVALRVLGLRDNHPGILAVEVRSNDPDPLVNQLAAGISGHAITITPGQLVVDYSEDGKIMYIHCLDIEASGKTLDAAQQTRLGRIRRILGRE